ncbi:MAG: thioesterase [Rikenellaceae bacterium]
MIQFYINPRDVDSSGFITLKSMIDFLIEAASTDADAKGIGLSLIRKEELSWVLSGMAIEVYNKPSFGETIMIDTWIRKINRIFSYRQFKVYNSEGEVIIEASSTWSMIDLKERRLANITKHIDVSSLVDSRNIEIEDIKRINGNFDASGSVEHKVVYSDIDMNNHVTSSKYVEWMCDTLKKPFECASRLKRFDINFINEVRFDSIVEIDYLTEETAITFSLKDEKKTTLCNAMLILS